MQRSFRIYEKRTNHSRDGEFKRVHTKRVYMYLSVFNRESGREREALKIENEQQHQQQQQH